MIVERATSIIYAVINAPKRRPMGGIRSLYKCYVRPSILWQISEQYRGAANTKQYAVMQKLTNDLERDIQELVRKYKLLDEHYITSPVRAYLLCVPPRFQHWHSCAGSILAKDVETVIQKADKEIALLKRKAQREVNKIVKGFTLSINQGGNHARSSVRPHPK